MTKRVDYDTIAAEYDRRYERANYDGVRDAVVDFVATADPPSILEVGCGTGHWLEVLSAGRASALAGVDPARRMLARARRAAPRSGLVAAHAEQLPWRSASFDRVLCVNALHHFRDPTAFFEEARRVLRPGGGLLVVGMDPHAGNDRWWVYDYFPGAREVDRKRFPSVSRIRALMADAGFRRCATRVVQRLATDMTVREGVERGDLERNRTSTLMVLDDDAYEGGVAQLRGAAPETRLETRIHLYATAGWVPNAAAGSGAERIHEADGA